MRKQVLIFIVFIMLAGGAAISHAQATRIPRPQPTVKPTPVVQNGNPQPQNNPFTLLGVANKIEEKLKGKSVGYAFVVMDRQGNLIGRAGGDARRAPDPNPRKMTIDDKLNIASVSKTITATAVLKLLHQRSIDINSPVAPYLPKNWKLGMNIDNISFKQLLTHRSGIRCENGEAYLSLRECLADGVKAIDKVTESYNNSNFALFRIIIPRLSGFDGGNTADNAIGNSIAASTYAAWYEKYVRENVFAPAGLNGLEEKAIAVNPALCYQYPAPKIAGESFGDMTLTGASRGWNVSAKQLAQFMHTLYNTEKIVPFAASKKMKDGQLGIWKDNAFSTGGYDHGGGYPGKREDGSLWNQGELNSYVVHFPNGMSIGVLINSQFGPGESFANQIKLVMKDFQK